MMNKTGQTRVQILGNVRRVVVQVGRSLLDRAPLARVRALATEIAGLRQGGIEVLVVTCGAVQFGAAKLGLKRGPRQVPLLQALSAVGQVDLMESYEDALAAHGIQVAQVIITSEDMDHRGRFLRLRHTLMALLDYGVVPLLGENLALGGDGLFADQNDLLAARLTRLAEADLLVLLTSAEGLYSSSPRKGGQIVHLVQDIDALAARVEAGMARRGGQDQPAAGKVQAARRAGSFGVPTVVASGLRQGVLRDLLDNDTVGTLLLPSRERRSNKQWIALDLEPAGAVRMSESACRAVVEEGRSLQAVDVLEVMGEFELGEALRLLDHEGKELGRGLSGYSAAVLRQVMGMEPAEIEKLTGPGTCTEAVRRDDLVIT